jgi:hypothetical protein
MTRALRPFRQRWPSQRDQELDEDRTAEITADLGGYLYPMFRPRRERWFDVEVVLEDDAAIDLWNDTIRDFYQMLRDTGAFRTVRLWRLRLAPLDATQVGAPKPATLEAPTGGRVSTRVLVGTGTRRLIFFATHGSSAYWRNGKYARILGPWIHSASVVLLQLMHRDRWKRTPLGDVHGFCYAQEPGVTSSMLRVERFWWSVAVDTENDWLLPVPAMSLEPAGVAEWANMQMARGRRCPVFLLDPLQEAIEEDRHPAGSAARDFERAVSALREVSADAFRLAVYLCSSAFTIPVARLIQEAKFGEATDQSRVAEVLLSGLVFARSPQDADSDPNMLYYDFWPEAREILMRSLREADAKSIADALQQHVSRYIERIYGRTITFQGLVPDENGNYELPTWAQPFAHVGLSLLGLPRHRENSLQLFQQFCASNPQDIVDAAALLARSASGNPLNPDAVAQEVWRALLRSRLIRQNADGQWIFLPGMEVQLTNMELLHVRLRLLSLLIHRIQGSSQDALTRKPHLPSEARRNCVIDFRLDFERKRADYRIAGNYFHQGEEGPLENLNFERLKRLAARSTAIGEVGSASWEFLFKEIGQELLEELFERNHQLLRAFNRALASIDSLENLQIRFTVDRSMNSLAFEALVDEDAKYRMLESPIYRTPVGHEIALFHEHDRIGPISQRRCLIVVADTRGMASGFDDYPLRSLRELASEGQWLEHYLSAKGIIVERLGGEDRMPAARANLIEVLRNGPWDMVHFAGHTIEQEDGNRAAIFLPGEAGPEVLGMEQLALLLRKAGTRFVYFSRSTSSQLAFELARKTMTAATVSFRWDIPDDIALEHARLFYDKLFQESNALHLAMLWTRQQLHDRDSHERFWASSVLIEPRAEMS